MRMEKEEKGKGKREKAGDESQWWDGGRKELHGEDVVLLWSEKSIARFLEKKNQHVSMWRQAEHGVGCILAPHVRNVT